VLRAIRPGVDARYDSPPASSWIDDEVQVATFTLSSRESPIIGADTARRLEAVRLAAAVLVVRAAKDGCLACDGITEG
jgi:hypothetical protein